MLSAHPRHAGGRHTRRHIIQAFVDAARAGPLKYRSQEPAAYQCHKYAGNRAAVILTSEVGQDDTGPVHVAH